MLILFRHYLCLGREFYATKEVLGCRQSAETIAARALQILVLVLLSLVLGLSVSVRLIPCPSRAVAASSFPFLSRTGAAVCG